MKFNKGIVWIITAILLLESISAFAVSSEFWEQNPLNMYPGETKEVPVILQNLAGTEDASAKGLILEGSEIAEFLDDSDLMIPLGQKKTVIVKITIPEEVAIGTNYNLKLSFSTTAGGQEGSVGFANNIERNIPIIVIEKTAEQIQQEEGITGKTIFETGPVPYVILILVVVLIAVIVIFIKKKKQKPGNKTSKQSR